MGSKKNPHALALESHGSEIAVIIRDFLSSLPESRTHNGQESIKWPLPR